MFTDMAGCTQLKAELGDQRGLELILQHHTLVRSLIESHPEAREIKTIGDAFFITFENPSVAVRFALLLQSGLRSLSKRVGRPLLDRIGIHSGEVSIEHGPDGQVRDLAGIQVDTCARVQGLCQPGRILMTHVLFASARPALKGQTIPGIGPIQWSSHGRFHLKGVEEAVEICEVAEVGKVEITPLADAEKARRVDGYELPSVETLSQFNETHGIPWWQRLRQGIRLHSKTAWKGVLVSIAAALFAILLPSGRFLTNLSYDLAYWFRTTVKPSGVLLVYMDDDSKDEFQESDLKEWKRSRHAQLVQRAAKAGARAVVFDLLLDSTNDIPSDPGGITRFVSSMQQFTNVFLSAKEVTEYHSGVALGARIVGPAELFRRHARWGVAEQTGADTRIRRHYTLKKDSSQPSLAEILCAEIAGRKPPAGVERWVNYYGPPGTIPFESYSKAISETRSADASFSNNVIFVGSKYGVGFRGGRESDEVETPYYGSTGEKSPGVEINATVFLNLMRGDWLRRAGVGVEVGLFCLIGMASGFGLVMLRPPAALAASVIAMGLITVISCTSTWFLHVWYAWAIPVLVQIPAATAWAIAVRSGRAESDRTQLEKTIAAQREALRSRVTATLPSVTSQPSSETVLEPPFAIPDYELLKVVGEGAYGEVWLARDITGNHHAAKLVHSRSFRNTRPFEREFEGLQRFSPISRAHPGLINILHVGRNEAARCFYYVMEAADDELTGRKIEPSRYAPLSLDKLIQKKAPLLPADAARLVAKLADALDFLHREGLTHRDIKPANVLFVRGEPKLADVGLVTGLAGDGSPISVVGTLAYMAPEGPGAPTADIFSLGKVLYELATGCALKDFPAFPAHAGVDSSTLQSVILKACETKPENRYQSAADLAHALRRIAAGGVS